MVTSWLAADSRLCLTSLSSSLKSRLNRWTSPNKSNTQTPTPGLVRWCVKAPILAEVSNRELNNKVEAAATREGGDCEDSESDMWNVLHLAVLETMLSLRGLEDASQLELLTITDMNRILADMLQLLSSLNDSHHNERVLLTLDRFAQFLQVALTTGAFRCSLQDLRRIVYSLPQTE